MDFIVDNYFWFIVGGIVVLMIIIGYIAEKTDFGRKPFKEKKADSKEPNAVNGESVETIENDENPVVISGTDESDEFIMEDGLSDVELPEDVVGESNVDIPEEFAEENGEGVTVEEPIETNEDVVEESMTDLDVPEIATDEEVTPEVSDVVEEVITDDSEDDVWKF